MSFASENHIKIQLRSSAKRLVPLEAYPYRGGDQCLYVHAGQLCRPPEHSDSAVGADHHLFLCDEQNRDGPSYLCARRQREGGGAVRRETKKVTFWVFVNMGVMAAISGLIFAARLNAATPRAGTNFELDAIAASFIGGASATGGIGTVFGAIIGGLVMGVLNNGMSLVGLGIDWRQGIKGLVLLAAVAFDIYNKRRACA